MKKTDQSPFALDDSVAYRFTQELNLQRGAYKTYDDFKAVIPSIIDSFYIESKPRKSDNWEETYSLVPKYSSSNKKIKKVWGFCDGSNIYIFHQIEFFPLEIQDSQLIFYGYGIVDNSAVGTAGVIGGAIGAGIYGATVLAQAKNQKVKYVIDPSTGQVVNKGAKAISKTGNLILYRRGSKEREEAINFTINESNTYSFVPSSYRVLNFNPSAGPISICPTTESSDCTNLILEWDEPKYVRVSFSKKDATPSITEVETSEGEFESVASKRQQKKRDKKIIGSER